MVVFANAVAESNVSIAKDNGDMVELALGVEPNDRVALNIRDDIAPGELVKPMDGDALNAGTEQLSACSLPCYNRRI